MRFWDTSAIVALCVAETRTPKVKALTQDDPGIVVWWGTPVECYSAFARLRRENEIDRAREDQARAVVHRLADEWTEILPGREVRETAARALLLHPLRALDALQLAAALVWAQGRGAGHALVCLDQRLRDAARAEGFAVGPPV